MSQLTLKEKQTRPPSFFFFFFTICMHFTVILLLLQTLQNAPVWLSAASDAMKTDKKSMTLFLSSKLPSAITPSPHKQHSDVNKHISHFFNGTTFSDSTFPSFLSILKPLLLAHVSSSPQNVLYECQRKNSRNLN